MITSPAGFNLNASAIQQLPPELFHHHPHIYIKRDDLLHPIVSGNKFRKLKYLIEEIQERKIKNLVTFGGAFSNHMVATAAAGAMFNIKTHCFVRGNEIEQHFNHYLKTASLFGMNLIPVERNTYASEKEHLFEQYFGNDPDCLLVAEGGESEAAIKGVAEIVHELDFEPDILLHASATATTARGLLQGIAELNYQTTLVPVAVLKNSEEQQQKINRLGLDINCFVQSDFTFGGYAKTIPELLHFTQDFIAHTGIFIDPVYTAKALFALQSLISLKQISPSQKVVFLHTGGTLGIFSDRFLDSISLQ